MHNFNAVFSVVMRRGNSPLSGCPMSRPLTSLPRAQSKASLTRTTSLRMKSARRDSAPRTLPPGMYSHTSAGGRMTAWPGVARARVAISTARLTASMASPGSRPACGPMQQHQVHCCGSKLDVIRWYGRHYHMCTSYPSAVESKQAADAWAQLAGAAEVRNRHGKRLSQV